MTVLAIVLAVLLWTQEGTHMITLASILLIVILIPAAMLMDAVMLFGPPENDPGVDRLLRYRPKRPPGIERDLEASRNRTTPSSSPVSAPERESERKS